jgi:hypothetical protein
VLSSPITSHCGVLSINLIRGFTRSYEVYGGALEEINKLATHRH